MAIGQTFKLDRIKEHSFEVFAKDMDVRPKLLTSLINEECKAVENEMDDLITEHERNYGEATIYEDLNKIIRSNTAQLQTFFR